MYETKRQCWYVLPNLATRYTRSTWYVERQYMFTSSQGGGIFSEIADSVAEQMKVIYTLRGYYSLYKTVKTALIL